MGDGVVAAGCGVAAPTQLTAAPPYHTFAVNADRERRDAPAALGITRPLRMEIFTPL